MAVNKRLKRTVGAYTHEARVEHAKTAEPARRFAELRYRTRTSWSCERRVVGKTEYWPMTVPTHHFVAINIPTNRASARRQYEDLYCICDEMENRLKEQHLGLFADGISTATMEVNHLGLYFPSFAYVLMPSLRRLGLERTELAKAQCTSIGLKLLMIGARVRATALAELYSPIQRPTRISS